MEIVVDEKRSKIMQRVQIVGAGLAGITAAIVLAKNGIKSNLISNQPSERAQSVLAEGGINAALNTMGEDDNWEYHYADTIKAGCHIADEEAVKLMTKNAPEVIQFLDDVGVPFNKTNNIIQLRNFGGQKKKRTAYVKSSTGKSVMTALINEARKYEKSGVINRYSNHEFIELIPHKQDSTLQGIKVMDIYTHSVMDLFGPVILAFGGMSGLFPNMTTGTSINNSNALAKLFSQGMKLSNLEMIQYHPTTIKISGKRCLVSEAARGEGGRLFVYKDSKPYFFMEEKYPELGNLMPRDIVSREMFFIIKDKKYDSQVYLDLTNISQKVLKTKLPDLCEEIKYYLDINPKKKPIPVEPGIHYFMGGIWVDYAHRTNVEGVYAAGECCSQYHGANRLGGNSLLGAIYGGMTSAIQICESRNMLQDYKYSTYDSIANTKNIMQEVRPKIVLAIGKILNEALGIVRNDKVLLNGIIQIQELRQENSLSSSEYDRTILAEAIIRSAIFRKESRGAHYRDDYPNTDINLCKPILVSFKEGIKLEYMEKK